MLFEPAHVTPLFVYEGEIMTELEIGELVELVPETAGITVVPEVPKPVFVLLLFHV